MVSPSSSSEEKASSSSLEMESDLSSLTEWWEGRGGGEKGRGRSHNYRRDGISKHRNFHLGSVLLSQTLTSPTLGYLLIQLSME